MAFTPFPLAADALALIVQSNGRIIVGGTTTGDAGTQFALAAYSSNGTLDQSFGSGGEVTTSFSGLNAILQVIISQPDGDIVASGLSSTIATPSAAGAALARYTSNGAPDATFGIGGAVALPGVNELSALPLLSNGQILLTANSIGLVLNANGSVPERVSEIVAIAQVGSMDFQINGELVSAAQQETERNGETDAVSLTRSYPTGLADSTFNAPLFYFNSGVKFEEFNQSSPLALLVTSGGQILVGGSSSTSATGPVFGLPRLNANGSLDSTFGSGGVTTTAIVRDDTVQKLLVQANAKIVAIGSAGSNLALARYLGH